MATIKSVKKLLKKFIDEESSAVDEYVELSDIMKEAGFPLAIVNKVREIARQEDEHYEILSKIYETLEGI